jgi:hypothetical protein
MREHNEMHRKGRPSASDQKGVETLKWMRNLTESMVHVERAPRGNQRYLRCFAECSGDVFAGWKSIPRRRDLLTFIKVLVTEAAEIVHAMIESPAAGLEAVGLCAIHCLIEEIIHQLCSSVQKTRVEKSRNEVKAA